MADRSVAVSLNAKVQGFVTGMRTAQKATEDFVGKGLDRVAKRSSAINDVSLAAGVMGGALVAGAGAAVAAFANFDQAMSNVQASTMESAGNMELLRDAALDAGARTAFSATEAAAGIEELAKAGVSTTDILNGGLDGALDLAAAGGIAVGEAAETAASAMTQFGLAGEDVTHIADLLAAGAGKAQGGVGDLGAALDQAGIVASQTGLSIEEAVGGLTAFAAAGLTGSDAGTSFKTMLQRLTPQSAEAQKQFDALGISAYDANGNFVGLAEFSGQLQTAMKDLTPEARNAAMSVMFGSDAVRAAGVLFSEGESGIRDWTVAVDDAGYAAEVAATRMDNLKGDWEEFTGSLETALIGAGEGADGPLRSLVQGATDAVNKFGELPASVQQGTVAIAGAGGLALLGVAGLGKLLTTAADLKTSFNTLGIDVGKVGGKMAKFGGYAVGVAATAVAAGALVDALKGHDVAPGAEALAKAIRDISEADFNAVGGQFDNFGTVLGMSVNQADSLTDAFDQMLAPSTTDRLSSFFDGIPGVTGYMENLEDRVAGLDSVLAGMLQAGEVEAVERFREGLLNAGYSAEEINSLLPETADAMIGVSESAGEAGSAAEGLASQIDFSTDAVDRQVVSLEELLGIQRDLAGVNLSAAEAQGAWAQQTLDNAEAVKELNGYVNEAGETVEGLGTAVKNGGAELDLFTEAGQLANSTLIDTASRHWDNIAAMEEADATTEELKGKTQEARDEFIETAIQMGLNEDAAKAMADEYGLVPEKIQTEAELKKAQAERDLQSLKDKLNSLPNPVISISTVGYAQSYAYLQSLQGIANSLRNNPVRIATGAGGSGGVTFAGGGPVFGPGTSTSDSIPARLSNGEYVIKADSVQRYGRSFFDQVNAQRFASGGMVGGGSSVSVGSPEVAVFVQASPDAGWVRSQARVVVGEAARAEMMAGRPA